MNTGNAEQTDRGHGLPKRDAYFIVLPGVMALDVTGPAEALQLAGQFTLHYIGPVPQVTSSTGLVLGGIEPLPDALPPGAILLVPGVNDSRTGFDTPEAQRVETWLRAQRTALEQGDRLLVGVCSGTLLAARAGLLDGYQCTTHHDVIARLRAQAPAAQVRENRIFIEDRQVLTSAGITAGIDVALHIIARVQGPQAATEVARDMVVYFRRSGDDPQLSPWLRYRNHLHPALHRAQNALIATPEARWQVEEVAARAHVSERHLARLFREHLGISVRDYHEQLRLAVARQHLQEGSGVEQAALAAGFTSARQLRRAQARWEVSSPAAAHPGGAPRCPAAG
ncbi:AraC family transcriptional regulator [Chimaeribacter coloradensis]|uniref:AraC family transcriptional regulator n=1 Tax=Chimaeribacter coloradensis TaxID=2060068 RepID=A0A2N5E3E6_9GAMM|nr:helix-turn-helix domain-containing protein [Chimaeribacter coloradensis]PLR35234.1 AraC family transcriptional regulator [Chimaeribacter coloradensis]